MASVIMAHVTGKIREPRVSAGHYDDPDYPGSTAVSGCLFFTVAFLVCILGVAVAHCQDRATPTRGTEGAPGMWVPLEQFRLALQEHEAAPRYVEQVRLLTESLSLAHAEIAARVEAQAATDAEAESLRQSVQVLIAQATQATARATVAESERDAWYRNPFLLVGIGLIVGVLGLGGVLLAIGT